jgi:hypothetical protein
MVMWSHGPVSLSVVFMYVRPQGVTTRGKFLAELTVISRRDVLTLNVFVQMGSVHSGVVAVGTHPAPIAFQYFGLD